MSREFEWVAQRLKNLQDDADEGGDQKSARGDYPLEQTRAYTGSTSNQSFVVLD
jgi:hypothetical protein